MSFLYELLLTIPLGFVFILLGFSVFVHCLCSLSPQFERTVSAFKLRVFTISLLEEMHLR